VFPRPSSVSIGLLFDLNKIKILYKKVCNQRAGKIQKLRVLFRASAADPLPGTQIDSEHTLGPTDIRDE
jgi:hypothetical protein